MAGMRIQGNQYVARVHFAKGSRPAEVKIPLRTLDEKTARIRRIEVERYQDDIKKGIPISFPWINGNGRVEVVKYTLDTAINEYRSARKADGLSVSSLDIARLALKAFEKTVGAKFPVELIESIHVDKFKQSCVTKKYSPTTINIRLRNIKTFLRWLKARNRLLEMPEIKLVRVPSGAPKYLSNSQFDKVCTKSESFLSDVFHFYRETGCRLSEPFTGEINGDFLTVREDTAKSRRSRDIYLTTNLMVTLIKMRANTHVKLEPKQKKSKTIIIRDTHGIQFYSREFKKACALAEIEGRRFHDLRHTAAVRMYLKTRDIYAVARQLGHSSVLTTEKYARFENKRLEQDFPDLVQSKHNDSSR